MSGLSIQNQQTMLSTEIVKIINDMREEGSAELLHKNFMAKIVNVLGEEHSAKFLAQYKDSTGRTLKCYALPKREASLMVMSESYPVQAAVYDRMTELERQAAKPTLPTTYLEALEHLVITTKENIQLQETVAEKEEVIAEQAPKVAALARLSGSEGSFNLTDAAKTLKVQRNKFITYLSTNRYIYKRGGVGNWIAYQNRIESGLLEHRPYHRPSGNGVEIAESQVVITSKGLTKLAQIFSVGAMTRGLSHA